MRDAQTRLVDPAITVDEQIEGHDARPPANVAYATEPALDLEEAVEQLPRRQGRLQCDRAVEEQRLLDDADRRRLPELRDGTNLDTLRLGEQVDGAEQRDLARADVRAEPNVRDCHVRMRSTITAAYSTGGSSTTSGFRTRTRARVTAGKRSTIPSATAPARPSRSRRSSPAKTSRTSPARRL